MQLANVVAPVATPVPAPAAAPIQAQVAAAPTTPPGQAVVAPPAPAAVADVDAGFGAKLGAKLLGGVSEAKLGAAGAHQRALESQQLLGAISAGLGERFSMIAKSVWSALRGTEAPTAPVATAPPAAVEE